MIQHYVIRFVSELRQVSGIFRGTLVSSTNKAEILLKMALNTIALTLYDINNVDKDMLFIEILIRLIIDNILFFMST